MGAEASLLAQELAEEIAKHKKGSEESELTRNAWDPKDKSPNVTINDNKTKAVRNDGDGTVDAVRGVMTYRRGVHLIEFEWTPGTNKYVAIGVATTSAPLTSGGDKQLLGSTDQSVGWNMVTRQIYFNGCETGKFPKDASSDYILPKKVYMVLNMNDGTLTFKADSSKIGIVKTGLKHMGEKLYIAAAMNKPWETVQVRYLGTMDALQKQLKFQESEKLVFHSICGPQVILGNENRTAARKDPSENVCYSTVLTNRPLKEGEIFSVRLDRTIDKYGCSWSVGLTTVSPQEIQFARDMSKNEQGKTWLCSENKIYFQRKRIKEMNGNIDKLKVGDIVGIKKEDQHIKIYVNNSQQTSLSMTSDMAVYGFVDIFGQARQVTIMDGMSDRLAGPLTESLKMPHTEEEYRDGIEKVIGMLKRHDKDKIAETRQALKIYMHMPFLNMKLERYKVRSAEFLANLEGSAKTITAYIRFLWDALKNEQEIAKCYLLLIDCAVEYSGKSILLSEQFGKAGLVKTGLYAIHQVKVDAVKTSEFAKLTLTEWLRLLQNCARVSDNQIIYRTMKFTERSQDFLTKYPEDYLVVVPIIMTMCFLVKDDRPPVISSTTSKHMLTVLQKAVDIKHSDGSHHFEGWCAHELAMCIGMLGQNVDNLKKITADDEVFKSLIKMFQFDEDKDKECAANSLWSLVADFNYMQLFKLPNLFEHLKKMMQSEAESVQQAARRLTMKLNNLREQKKAPTSRTCDYFAKCAKFMDTLKITDAYVDKQYDKCYCIECHSMRSDKAYYNRGVPPKTHAIPVGWARFGLKAPARAFANKAHTDWHTAYHGTKQDHIPKILDVGYLVPAGREVIGGINIHEGSKHYSDDWKPDGFDTKQVFFSPSIRYAGVDAYARPNSFELNDASGKPVHYASRVAFQILVKPGSYKVGKETIGAMQAIDPGFSNQELEWSTTQDGATILNAILIKVDKF